LIIPSFTFLDRKNRSFSLTSTKPTLGWFNDYVFEIFRKSKKIITSRTNSCTHSFIVLGKDAKYIAASTSPYNAFGKGSIFDYLYKKNGYWVNIGCEANQGYSLIHQVETTNNVDYRELIRFPVTCSHPLAGNRVIQYTYPSRKEKYNTNQRYDRLVNHKSFKCSNLYKGDRRLSIHKYDALILNIENLLNQNQFYFIEN